MVGAARSHPGIRERREKREERRGKGEGEREKGKRSGRRRRKKVGGAAAGIAGVEREGGVIKG